MKIRAKLADDGRNKAFESCAGKVMVVSGVCVMVVVAVAVMVMVCRQISQGSKRSTIG